MPRPWLILQWVRRLFELTSPTKVRFIQPCIRLKAVKVIGVFGEPKPDTPPENVPIWPLWYVAWAFILTRLAGLLFVAGLAANAIFPIFL